MTTSDKLLSKEEIREGVGWTNLTKKSHPNFCDDRGDVYLVKCPKCKKENYSLAVVSGQCAWCGFDLNKYINKND